MDDLISEFIIETSESLQTLDCVKSLVKHPAHRAEKQADDD